MNDTDASRSSRGRARQGCRPGGRIACGALILLLAAAAARTQSTPSSSIEEDCQVFAIAPDNSVAFSVARVKGFEKLVLERDEIWISSPRGGKRRIVEADKFMPIPPPASYSVKAIAWSPDSSRLAVAMTTKQYPWSPKVKGKKKGDLGDDTDDNTNDDTPPPDATGSGNVLALFDATGAEIKVTGASTRFLTGALSGAWLADNRTVVYLTGSGQIVRVDPESGKSATLFEGRKFEGVAWDTRRNRAFVVGTGITSRMVLAELDLVKETVAELARLDAFEGGLTVSPSGKAVGYMRDGDTIEVRLLAQPDVPLRVRTGPGRFEFDGDDRRILLKRGPAEKSNDLVWVNLRSGNFTPILHDLVYHDFHIAPDGKSLGVVAVGRGVLTLYPLE